MKLELKRNYITRLIALVLSSATFNAVHAGDTIITGGGGSTSASIDDAGYFSSATPLGFNFLGREFINNSGTGSSNYSLYVNGAPVAIADEITGSNPFGASIIASSSSAVILGNLSNPSFTGWIFVETVSIPRDGIVAFQIQLTNETGASASDVQWSFGLNPDQGITVGMGSSTLNGINATGSHSSVVASSADGWGLEIRNTTNIASAFSVTPYIDLSACCNPVDPAVMVTASQVPGMYGFADNSINLAYNLGTINAHETVSFGYTVGIPIPEPETYVMLLVGLSFLGFIVRRKKINRDV
ncbi:MAG: PEP-CTERM sorting domain-containing protein [Proteobacteria bacterium]|nr:PEP-CTERM sorting domain-containing protein [Pseudomonadota bacterium]